MGAARRSDAGRPPSVGPTRLRRGKGTPVAITRERIETLWMRGELETLARELAERRTEWSAASVDRVPAVPGAAALGILTLHEGGSECADPLIQEMAAALQAGQEAQGNWGGPGSTALVLRSLACCGREQACYARGLAYLATSQSSAGTWPAADDGAGHDTAFVLTMLGDLEDFRDAVDVERAVEWYRDNRFERDRVVPDLFDASEKQWSVALQRVGQDRAAV